MQQARRKDGLSRTRVRNGARRPVTVKLQDFASNFGRWVSFFFSYSDEAGFGSEPMPMGKILDSVSSLLLSL
jgi:hypothetical protein